MIFNLGDDPILYEEVEHRKLFITSSGEETLETHVILPITNDCNSWPILLTRTPYFHMDKYQNELGTEFAKRGIGYVYQYSRGIGESSGKFVPNIYEEEDGKATLKWLNEQKWCNKIGIHGSSYMALTSWVIADSLTDKVVGMFVSHYGIDRYKSAYQAGLFRHDILTGWSLGNSGSNVLNQYNFYDLYMQASNYRPHIEADEKIWNVKLDWYKEWISKPDYADPYWNSGFWGSLKEKPSKVTVPVCIIAGWYDHHLEGTILSYDTLNPLIKPYSKLIVGAWNHFFQTTTGAHDDTNASIEIHLEMYKWFKVLFAGNRYLQNSYIYMIGEDSWLEQMTQNINTHETKTLFLTGNCGLSEVPDDLTTVLHYDYDPNDPIKSCGGETLFVSEDIRGVRIQPELKDRGDLIEFDSQKFEECFSINGRIKINLTVSSDCEDTCFAVKIIDVFEDNSAYNIRNQITTLAYRNNSKIRMNYLPNSEVKLVIETLPIAWQMKKGHRLRLQISSSNFPEYAIHSNYPGIWSQIRTVKTAHQNVYIGYEKESCIEIPILKGGISI